MKSSVVTEKQMKDIKKLVKGMSDEELRDSLSYCMIRVIEFEALALVLKEKGIINRSDFQKLKFKKIK